MIPIHKILTRLVIMLLLFSINSCKKNGNKNIASTTAVTTTKKATVSKANKTIYLLPLGNIPDKIVTTIYKQLKGYIPAVRLLPKEALPAFAFYSPRKRHRADKLIQWMSSRANTNEVYVGITTTDISATKGTVYDWGVMVLGYRPGRACVASSYRIKNKSNFYKIVLHEIGHTTGLDHCPVKSCFMRDAEGKDPTGEENEFCSKCKSVLSSNNWVF